MAVKRAARVRRWMGAAAPLVAMLALLVPATAQAAPPSNNNKATPATQVLGYLYDHDTTEATIEPAEPFTDNTAPGELCDGAKMGNTIWVRVFGTGRPVTVDTIDSDDGRDTVMAAYDAGLGDPITAASMLDCNDDVDAEGRSAVTFDTDKGVDYMVQIGDYAGDGATPVTPVEGPLVVAGFSFPPNDLRADAAPITPGQPLVGDNLGAIGEQNEDRTCEADGNAPISKTVWAKFTVTEEGTATISASGFDTVMQIYRAGENGPFACNDDGVPGTPGPSRIQMRLGPGEYLIQVGGFGSTSLADDGDLTIQLEFEVDFDLDDDGSNRPADCNDRNGTVRPGASDPLGDGVDQNCDSVDGDVNDRDGDGSVASQDCNDSNPGIRPGAPETPENGVDEDCDGVDAVRTDRDGDGVNAPADCNDNNPAIRPGTPEIPGNSIDENCDRIVRPFPRIGATYGWNVGNDGLTLTKLDATLKRGQRVTLSCRGRGCFRPMRVTARRDMKVNFLKKLKKSQRKRRHGNVLTMRITQKDTYGILFRATLRKGKKTRSSERCLSPNANRTVKCP